MQCPYCREEIHDESKKCKHCGGDLYHCPDCNKMVGVSKKDKWVGMARGGHQETGSCLNCGKQLFGPSCFIATAAYGSPYSVEVNSRS